MRQAYAKDVDAKAALIKEWVVDKILALEDENTILKEQHAKDKKELERLGKRLEQLEQTLRTQSPMAEVGRSVAEVTIWSWKLRFGVRTT